MRLLNFILVAALIFYFVKWLGRVMLQGWVEKKQKEFSRQAGGNGRQNQGRRREGEVRVYRTTDARKKVNKDIGDYVEYEEVDED